ncbi:MAG: hypothetical protein PUB53_08040 [Bacteroidales bacterium]|nr:hypothetical protein [Bacteroidales bacterium]
MTRRYIYKEYDITGEDFFFQKKERAHTREERKNEFNAAAVFILPSERTSPGFGAPKPAPENPKAGLATPFHDAMRR